MFRRGDVWLLDAASSYFTKRAKKTVSNDPKHIIGVDFLHTLCLNKIVVKTRPIILPDETISGNFL